MNNSNNNPLYILPQPTTTTNLVGSTNVNNYLFLLGQNTFYCASSNQSTSSNLSYVKYLSGSIYGASLSNGNLTGTTSRYGGTFAPVTLSISI